MKKSLIVIGTIIIFSLIAYIIYNSISSFDLFEESSQSIKTIENPGRDYKIGIYYMPANATTQSNIQVRKLLNGQEEILESFERYNFLESTDIRNDTLMIRVKDTSRNHVKAKSFFIKLPR